MSKQTAIIPLANIDRIQLYINKSGKSLQTVMKETGADYGMNGGIFNGSKSLCNVKANGIIINGPGWKEFGYAWDSGADISMCILPDNHQNYLGCVVMKPYDGASAFSYPKDMGGTRGRTAMGIAGKNLILYCTGDGTKDAATPEGLQKEMVKKFQCDTALMLDGGGSSQCNFKGKTITASRRVANIVLVYLRKGGSNPVSDKKKVVLDPGHGAQSNNKSPDGTFSEPEFALDMAERMRAILTRHGVEVTLTRTGTNNPTGKADTNDLAYRCNVANAISGLDLFVSLHTNASGTGWSDASGWSVYTSSAGVSAGRNIAANKVIARIREAGIATRAAALVHDRLYVLKNTTAPAMLIEHAFHTNKGDVALLNNTEHRKKLAVAQCKGILDYLGIAYDGQDSVSADTPAKDTGVSDWAAVAWQKATTKGIVDGTNPQGNVTREMLAVVLDRLGLI